VSKAFLFVMQASAYDGNKIQEALDIVLITAAFDQKVSILLLDDAVFHLKNNQQSEQVSSKDIGALYRSLELYDIENIFVENDSIITSGLSEDDLLVPIKVIRRQEVGILFSQFDYVLNG